MYAVLGGDDAYNLVIFFHKPWNKNPATLTNENFMECHWWILFPL